jgi:glycopeptide antibiotics resistance protein
MDKILIQKKFKTATWIIFTAYLLILVKLIFFKLPLYIILTSFKSDYYNIWLSINLIPFKTIIPYLQGIPAVNIAIENLLGNVLLFLPFGFLLPLLTQKINSYKRIFITAIIFSFSLEIAQLTLHVGSFDVDDIILNTTGAMLGYMVANKIFTLQSLNRT